MVRRPPAGRCSGRYRPAAHQPFASAITPSRPARADPLARPRRRLLHRRFLCLPTHARLWHRPAVATPIFSHLDCRSVLILIVALQGGSPYMRG